MNTIDSNAPLRRARRWISQVVQDHRLRMLVKGILLAIAWALPGFLLSSVHHSLEYDFVQNVRVAASQDGRYLLPITFGGFEFSPEHQGSEILKLMLVHLTGLPIEEMQYLPVGAFLVPFTFYILCKELVDPTLAALLSISVAFDPTVVFGSYHTAIYAWSRTLLLAFLFLYVKIVKRKNRSLVLLSNVLFFAAFCIYWTAPALMITYSFLLNGLLLIVYLVDKKRQYLVASVLTISSSLTFLIIYLGYGEVLYRYLPRIVDSVYGEEFSIATLSLYRRVLQLVGILSPDPEVFIRYGSDSAVQSIQVIRYSLMGAAVAWLVAGSARRLFKERRFSISIEPMSLVLISILGMLLTHTLLYAAYGHASTRYLALLGPLICILALHQSGVGRGVKAGAAIVLGVLACVSFAMAYQQVSERSDWDTIRAAKGWLVVHGKDEAIVTNVGTYAMLAMELARDGEQLDYACFTTAQYDTVIGRPVSADQVEGIEGYIVIDKNVTDHELCPGFRYYEPFSHYIDEIRFNEAFNAIYDNGGLWILHSR